MVFFQLGPDRLDASFGIRAMADGLRDMAQLRAEVVYQDGDFTLRNIRLIALFGV